MNCNSKYIIKTFTTMAEIIENKMPHEHHEHNVPSMAKANAGLTLG